MRRSLSAYNPCVMLLFLLQVHNTIGREASKVDIAASTLFVKIKTTWQDVVDQWVQIRNDVETSPMGWIARHILSVGATRRHALLLRE